MPCQPHRIISEWKRKVKCDSHSYPTLPISACIYWHSTFHYRFSTEWKKKQNVIDTVTLLYPFQPAFTAMVLFTTDFSDWKRKQNVTVSHPTLPVSACFYYHGIFHYRISTEWKEKEKCDSTSHSPYPTHFNLHLLPWYFSLLIFHRMKKKSKTW